MVILLTVADEIVCETKFLGDRKVIQTWSNTIKHTNGTPAIEQMRNGERLSVSLCASFSDLDYQPNLLQGINLAERKI